MLAGLFLFLMLSLPGHPEGPSWSTPGGPPRTCRPRHPGAVPQNPFGLHGRPVAVPYVHRRVVSANRPMHPHTSSSLAGPFRDAPRFTLRQGLPESAGPASPVTQPVYPKTGRGW